MRFRSVVGDESGMSLIEVMISMLLLSIVIVSVDASVTVVQEHEVQVNDQTQALDNLQMAQQAISRDIHAATTPWTTPAVPTSAPGSPVTATTLSFTAALGSATTQPVVNISLNTTTHVLTVTCTGVGCSKTAGAATVVTQAQVSNIDSSSLFTLTTQEVSTTVGSVSTNAFFYTAVSSKLVLDTPKVGAHRVFQTTLTNPNMVTNNIEYDCQDALNNTGASGSC
jgi:prepilin-type N-terminal cleavage/methylation domain-containing protein